jgi:toxin ParE1/3/4
MARVYRVEFSRVAEGDLNDIALAIALDDLGQALKVVERIEARCASLARMPKRGRVVPELKTFGIDLYRESIVAPWRIMYRIFADSVLVVAVVDGRRNVEDILLARLIR